MATVVQVVKKNINIEKAAQAGAAKAAEKQATKENVSHVQVRAVKAAEENTEKETKNNTSKPAGQDNGAQQAASNWDKTNQKIINSTNSANQFAAAQKKINEKAGEIQQSWKNISKSIGMTFGAGLDLDQLITQLKVRLGDQSGSALLEILNQQAGTYGSSVNDLIKNVLLLSHVTKDTSSLAKFSELAQQLALINGEQDGGAAAAKALQAALEGSSSSLQNYGITADLMEEKNVGEINKTGDTNGALEKVREIMQSQNVYDDTIQQLLNTPKHQLQGFTNNIKDGFATAGAAALQALQPMLEQLTAFFQSQQGQAFFTMLGNALYLVAAALTFVLQGVMWLANIIQENWTIIEPILSSLLIVYLAAMIAKLILMAGATLMNALAWIAMNAPIVATIALILVVIKKILDMGGTFEGICGIIGGLLGGLYAFGYNLIADMWNYIATFGEFFANVFNDPIGSIIGLFLGLADVALGVIETIANALDAVFGSNMAETVAGWRSDIQAKRDEITADHIKFDRMEKIDAADTALQWSETGASFGKSIDDMGAGLNGLFNGGLNLDKLGGAKSSGINLDELLGNGASNTAEKYAQEQPTPVRVEGGNLDSLGSINEDIGVSQESLDLLKESASKAIMVNLAQLTPQLKIEKIDIAETADSVKVMDAVELMLQNALSSTVLEGV